MIRRLRLWKYRRRAARLSFIIRTLGVDQAIIFGGRRGWIDHVEDGNIHLRRTGWL